MSQSKIAIAVAPAACSFTIAQISTAIATTGGVALIVSLQNSEKSVEEILELADGIVLVCPEEKVVTSQSKPSIEADFFRYFGRAAVHYGINSVALIGDRSAIGTDQDWQDWAFFRRSSARPIDLADEKKGLADLQEFVSGAGTVSAFARMARSNRRSLAQELKSPVTHS